MANFIIPYLKSVTDLWNSVCFDQHQKSLFEFKGQTGSLGSDWTSRYLRSEEDVHNLAYLQWHKRFTEDPELKDVISDNVWRLTLFAGVERILSIRQAQAVLKTQFAGVSQSFSGAAQSVFNGGLFRKGYFRGSILNMLQFCGAPYQSLIWTRNSNIFTQIGVASLFEAFLYPLDTIKTLLYCDVQGKYSGALNCASQLVETSGAQRLYAGLGSKIFFNAFLIFHLNKVYDGSDLQWVSFPLLLLTYPLLVNKSRQQVAGTPVSLISSAELLKVKIGSNYAGAVPFLVFNTLFAYQFAAWYSPTAQNRVVSKLQNAMKQLQSPEAEESWSH